MPTHWPDAEPNQRQSLTASLAPSLIEFGREGERDESQTGQPRSFKQIVNPSEDPDLLFCRMEAKALRETLGTTIKKENISVLRGRRAGRNALLEAFFSGDIVHFAGHALFNWQAPLKSALICARLKTEPHYLTLEELLHQHNNQPADRSLPKLVILSACQIGSVQANDINNDLINLPTTLLSLGVHTVLAARWQVGDLPTAILLSRVIRRWHIDKLPLATALIESQRWLQQRFTTRDLAQWLDNEMAALRFGKEKLLAVKAEYWENYASDERPFQSIEHWGAFELFGDPYPFKS